ncbi:uncharacterized transmembrane protein DDB_G0283675-like [Cephus cinctus]|uniref:Uncharacterized transmembrane protein DDB_G0283675-like n=1 Tax=Cephus cinctus TaxID=211228 RepID=A0AAJ7CFZ1_CEPCN|nr:uncharacterized transmembrane protein DDB_G0283675-like [Cephus cinctus]
MGKSLLEVAWLDSLNVDTRGIITGQTLAEDQPGPSVTRQRVERNFPAPVKQRRTDKDENCSNVPDEDYDDDTDDSDCMHDAENGNNNSNNGRDNNARNHDDDDDDDDENHNDGNPEYSDEENQNSDHNDSNIISNEIRKVELVHGSGISISELSLLDVRQRYKNDPKEMTRRI